MRRRAVASDEPGGRFGPGPGPSSSRVARGRYPGSLVSRTSFGPFRGQTSWLDCRVTGFRIELRSGLLSPCKRKRCTSEACRNTFCPRRCERCCGFSRRTVGSSFAPQFPSATATFRRKPPPFRPPDRRAPRELAPGDWHCPGAATFAALTSLSARHALRRQSADGSYTRSPGWADRGHETDARRTLATVARPPGAARR